MERGKREVYSVSQINFYIRDLFEQNRLLMRLSVRGEISNCKYHSSGHIYFTVKDAGSQLACVMFAGMRAGGLDFRLQEGQSVVVTGNISVYERDGKYQLYARKIERDGVGVLYQRFEQLKEKLLQKGYFDPADKKPIPAFPKKVGIVTAETGAAIQDIRNIAGRRNPYVQLVLCPAQVQGVGAAHSIAAGIRRLSALGVDTIIIGRGGGSIEDLWAFNEEEVADAIRACQVPIISAVGHETDFTIADFTADLRAPTPSAAAELAVPDIRDILGRLYGYQGLLSDRMKNKLRAYTHRLEQGKLRLQAASPAYRLRQQRQRQIDLEEKLSRLMRMKLVQAKNRLAVSAERLNGLSPLARLAAGYSYVTDGAGKTMRSVEAVEIGKELHIYMSDGSVQAQVTEIEKKP